MNILTGYATNQGRYREKNQDSVVCLRGTLQDRELVIACVCDGIGSFKNSEVAAIMITQGIERWFEGITQFYPKDIETDEILQDLKVTIEELNEIVYEYRVYDNEEVGCTMSLILFIDDKYYIYQVGDSRIYSLKEELVQLTTDDVVTREVNGKVKKLLANYMGKSQKLQMSNLQGSAEVGELFLVSSDGVYKRLEAEDLMLLKVINQDSILERECNNLLETILDRGEKDNLTCAVVMYSA